jgi:hypothetical protein
MNNGCNRQSRREKNYGPIGVRRPARGEGGHERAGLSRPVIHLPICRENRSLHRLLVVERRDAR